MLKFNQLCCLFLGLLLVLSLSAQAQGQVVAKGRVVDESHQPLAGASVVEKETRNAVITDRTGAFNMSVRSSDAVLVISYLGRLPVEVAVNSPLLERPLVLHADKKVIGDVVVIGYGTVRKNDLTGAVSAIRAEELNKGTITSPQDLLMGKIPGVHIVQGDGAPGSGSQIRIRGMASLTASNDPLIVIDGIPISNDGAPGMSNPLNTINANDIESFTVLKDASSTAIYGARASNGVIIITTKKGGGKKLNLNYSSSYSVSTNPKTIKTMSGNEYRDFMSGYKPTGTPQGDMVHELMGDANTDWQDKVFQNAFAMDHNLSAYGSFNENFPYRISLGYSNEDGTLKTSKYERTTLDISIAPTFFDKHLQVSINAKGVYNQNNYVDGGVLNAAAFYDPTQTTHFYRPDGSVDKERANGLWNWFTEDGRPNYLSWQSPLSLMYDRYDKTNVYRMLGNIQLDYKLHWLPELRFNLNLGLDMARVNGHKGDNPGSFHALRQTHPKSAGLATYDKYRNQRSNELLEFYIAYGDERGKHRYDILGGYSWQHYYKKDYSTTYVNTTNELFHDEPQPTYRTENYQIAFFGRANYSYDDRFLFTASLRADASSRFHKDVRWGYFPAAAFAWRMSNEAFLRDSRVLSDLKLRVSWGQTGQQDLGDDNYPYIPRYNLSSDPYNNYVFNGAYYPTLKPEPYNKDIKWETTTTYNVGVDFGFLKGRISGSVDYYFRETKDLLNHIATPMGSNFSNTLTANIGSMENQGVEIALNAVAVQTRDWTLHLGVNATGQKTKISKLTMANKSSDMVEVGGISSGQGNTIQVHSIGHAPYTFYTYSQVYDQNGKPIQNTFVDIDGDGVITMADRIITNKKPTPDWFYGITARVDFRNWDLGFNGHGSINNWMFNDFYSSSSTPAAAFYTQGHLSNYAKLVTRTGFKEANSNQQSTSDLFLEDASFFRMDNITFGYTFPNIAKTGLKLRAAFTVQNVFVITDYSGLDPEGSGIDNNIWPRPRIYGFSLNLNF